MIQSLARISWWRVVACLFIGITTGRGQNVSFTVAPVFPAGISPTSLAAGNFNTDGKPDLAVTNQSGVAILLNDGNGGFLPPVSYTVGTNPVSVAVADFNGDEKMDLAVVNQGSGSVSILLGRGDGTFVPAVNYSAGSSPRRVVIADFNGDGRPDLAIADAGFATGSGVSVLIGNSDGTFKNAVFYAAGSVSIAVAVADFNHDTKADLVVVNSGSDSLTVFLGNGDGTFPQTGITTNLDLPGKSVSPTFAAVADFDRDGKQDVALSTPNHQTVAILLGLGNGSFQPAIHYTLDDPNLVNNLNVIAALDMNGDGWPDLVMANSSSNHVTVLLNSQTGTFSKSRSWAAGSEPTCLTIADFNADGIPDIAVNNNFVDGRVSVLYGNADGSLQGAPIFRSAYVPQVLAVGDINNDGKLDIIAASHYSNVATTSGVAMLGNGDGTFQAPLVWSPTGGSAVALGDFNGDHKLDLAVTVPGPGNGNVSVLLGKGDGTFLAPVPYNVGTTPQAVAVGDLNGDGKPDIVVGNHNSSNISVLIGNGDGTFKPAVNYPTPASGTADSLTIGDFNGDKKLDVAVAISGVNAGTVAIFLGNGDGTLTAQTPAAAGFHSPSTLVVTSGDFDGNGVSDLAVTDGQTLAILGGAGNGSFSGHGTYLVGAGPGINGVVVAGDFNGDGKLDVLTTSRDGMALFLNTGQGFGSPVTYTPFIGGAAAVGDFNGDNKLDVATADSSQDATITDTVAVMLNTTQVPVEITVDTLPTDLQAQIEGYPLCTTPCHATYYWGTVQSIGVFAYQSPNIRGERYRFDHWSDGGALTHNIDVPAVPTTYTASYVTQDFLGLGTSPAEGGTIQVVNSNDAATSSGLYVDTGTVVQIAVQNSLSYVFENWTGDVDDTTKYPAIVTMNVPKVVTAVLKFTGQNCDLEPDAQLNVADAQNALHQALGVSPPTAKLHPGGYVNVMDVQTVINVLIGNSPCPQ